MEQEEKQLLLKDLCARLPYGVNILADIDKEFDGGAIGELVGIIPQCGIIPHRGIEEELLFYQKGCLTPLSIEEIRPYLRPMSSMTEEEKREAMELGVCDDGAFHNDVYDVGTSMEEAFTAISWFLERHFDINYLIQRGLALEAPEGMYKID